MIGRPQPNGKRGHYHSLMVDSLDSPGVLVPPPAIFAAGFLTGLLLDRLLALPRFTPPPLVGVLLIGLGAGLAVWAVTTFVRHRTAIIPHRPASRLVMAGPYRHSRNPMYLALTTAYLGLTLALGRWGPLLLLLPTLVTLVRMVIVREERYLAVRFATDYEAYRTRVGRWL